MNYVRVFVHANNTAVVGMCENKRHTCFKTIKTDTNKAYLSSIIIN